MSLDITHVVAFLLGVACTISLEIFRKPKRGSGQRPPKAPPPTSTGDSVGNPYPTGVKPPYRWPPPPPGRRLRGGDVPPAPNPLQRRLVCARSNCFADALPDSNFCEAHRP